MSYFDMYRKIRENNCNLGYTFKYLPLFVYAK